MRIKLLHISRQKWASAADVESTFVNRPQAMQSAGSLFTLCGYACPFHASVLRPASQVGPMHEAAGMGEFS